MPLTDAEVTRLLLDSPPPSDMVEVPDDTNAITLYAQEKSGAWLPALTLRVDVNEIAGDNWRRPLRLAGRGERCKFPE